MELFLSVKARSDVAKRGHRSGGLLCAIGAAVLFFGAASLAAAQNSAEIPSDDPLGILTYDAGGRIIGRGPGGRLSSEQGQILALRRVSGELLGHSVDLDKKRYFYEYRIRVNDGSIYEVEINAANGSVREIEIEYLSEYARLPHAVLPEKAAINLAENHLAENTLGRRAPKTLKSGLAVRNRDPVYHVQLKKSGQTYDVVLDAISGDVLDFDKQ